MDNVLNLLIPFAGNLLSCLVLVLGIYHVISKRRDYVFSFILVSSAVYLLCNLLMAVEIDLAFHLAPNADNQAEHMESLYLSYLGRQGGDERAAVGAGGGAHHGVSAGPVRKWSRAS